MNRQYLNQVIVHGSRASENKWTGTVKHAGDVFSGTMIMTGDNNLKVNGLPGHLLPDRQAQPRLRRCSK